MASKRWQYKPSWSLAYRKRQESAWSAGYDSYWQLRRAIEKGLRAPMRPQQVRNPRTVAAQRARVEREVRANRARAVSRERSLAWTGFSNEDMAAQWSVHSARTDMAKYYPEETGNEVLRKHKEDYIAAHGFDSYTDAYLLAWVTGADRYAEVRHSGGSEWLRYWLVDITESMTAEEYDERYGEVV